MATTTPTAPPKMCEAEQWEQVYKIYARMLKDDPESAKAVLAMARAGGHKYTYSEFQGWLMQRCPNIRRNVTMAMVPVATAVFYAIYLYWKENPAACADVPHATSYDSVWGELRSDPLDPNCVEDPSACTIMAPAPAAPSASVVDAVFAKAEEAQEKRARAPMRA
jgi:hypothetical protein